MKKDLKNCQLKDMLIILIPPGGKGGGKEWVGDAQVNVCLRAQYN